MLQKTKKHKQFFETIKKHELPVKEAIIILIAAAICIAIRCARGELIIH